MTSIILFALGFTIICAIRVQKFQGNHSEIAMKRLGRYNYLAYAILLVAFVVSSYGL